MRKFLVCTVLYIALSLCSCGEDTANVFHVDIVSYLDQGRDIEMVALPGGTFVMGSDLYPPFEIRYGGPGMPPDTVFNLERPVHFVNLSPFLIASTEITHEQYAAVMNASPSHYSGETDMPVESVSWFQAAEFCNALSELMGLDPCYGENYECDFSADGFRLPTEAEWEYAARGGTETEFYFGDSESGIGLNAWYIGNSESKPHPVAGKEPNDYGLYDMHGNVNEWCNDYFYNYSCGVSENPTGPDLGFNRSFRGGSWGSSPRECRSAYRAAYRPDFGITTIGFRIVRRR